MIAMRRFLLFSCLALVTGCSGVPCPRPGFPSEGHQSCVYILDVTKVDPNANLVTATDLLNRTFVFRVHDLDKLTSSGQLKANEQYVFSGVSNSPYLELFTPDAADYLKDTIQDAPEGKIKKRPAPRDRN